MPPGTLHDKLPPDLASFLCLMASGEPPALSGLTVCLLSGPTAKFTVLPLSVLCGVLSLADTGLGRREEELDINAGRGEPFGAPRAQTTVGGAEAKPALSEPQGPRPQITGPKKRETRTLQCGSYKRKKEKAGGGEEQRDSRAIISFTPHDDQRR